MSPGKSFNPEVNAARLRGDTKALQRMGRKGGETTAIKRAGDEAIRNELLRAKAEEAIRALHEANLVDEQGNHTVTGEPVTIEEYTSMMEVIHKMKRRQQDLESNANRTK